MTTTMPEHHEHELSYLLKTDEVGNLVAIVEQTPQIVVTGSLNDLDNKIQTAVHQYFQKDESEHVRVFNDNSPRFIDNGVGITVGTKRIKVPC